MNDETVVEWSPFDLPEAVERDPEVVIYWSRCDEAYAETQPGVEV